MTSDKRQVTREKREKSKIHYTVNDQRTTKISTFETYQILKRKPYN